MRTNMERRLIYHHRTRGTGVEGVHIRGIVQTLERRNWKVTIVSPPGVPVEGVGPAPKKSGLSWLWNVVASRMPEVLFEAVEIAYNACSLYKLNRALDETSATVIYERYALFSWAGTWLARRRGIPIVLEVNDATVIVRSRPLSLRWVAHRLEGWIFRNATHLVTVSENFRDLISNGHQIPCGGIRVLPNAVHPHQVASESYSTKTSGPITLGMVAAFLPWHGLELVIKGTKDFLKETNSRLVLVGDGPERTRLTQWIDEYDLRAHVELTGFVPAARVSSFLDEMDVCVIGNSADHASPMKLFEYLGRGKPVIAPAVGPICEIVTHKANGWLFEALNRDSLLEAVRNLHADPELRTRLGDAARNTILSKHTWDHRVQEIESWLEAANAARHAPDSLSIPARREQDVQA